MIDFLNLNYRNIKATLPRRILLSAWLVLMLVLVACQTQNNEEIIRPVSDDLNDAVAPLLVQSADMGWNGYYVENESSINLFPEIPVEHIIGTSFSPIPISRSSKGADAPDIRGVGQTVYIYLEEEYAVQAFKINEEFMISDPYGRHVYEITTNPAIKNALVGCSQSYASDFGEHLGCEAWFQHGRYLVRAVSIIDGEVVTNDDWDKLLTLVQDRLVAHVEQEATALP